MPLTVLVTRPEPEASLTAADIERRGHVALLAPMLTPRFLEPAPPAGRTFDAVAATSQNGVRGLARLDGAERLQRLPFYAVGDATAREARCLGFTDVRSAGGALADLADLLASAGGIRSLLYAAGVDRAGDLAAALDAAGIAVTTLEVYRMDASARLPDEVATSLAGGSVDRILIYSERTAAALVAVLREAGLLDGVAARISAHAISARAAEPLVRAGFASIVVSDVPRSDALLLTLDRGQLDS